MDNLDKTILDAIPWEKLPATVKQALGNSRTTWGQAVVDRSLRYQLRWTQAPLVKEFMKDEKQYYSEMVKLLQKNFLVRQA